MAVIERALPATGAEAPGRLALPVQLYLVTVLLTVSVQIGPLYVTGLRALLIVLVLPLAFGLVNGRFGPLRAVDGFFAAHLLWAGLALALDNPGRVVENFGAQGVEFSGGYLLARAHIRSAADFRALCRALTLLTLATLPLALWEAATGKAPLIALLSALPGVATVAPVEAGLRLGLHRVQMDFAHPIHYGLFCSVAFVFCLLGLNGVFQDRVRRLAAAAVALCGGLALSSGALLAMALQLGLLAWHRIFGASRYCWGALIGVLGSGYLVVDLAAHRTPMQLFMAYATFDAQTAYYRKLIFDWGMVNVLAHPAFGIGLNDWVRPTFMASPSVDNFWLLTAMRYGLPGFAFLAAGWGLALVQVARRDLAGDPGLEALRRAWVFAMVGLSFTLATVDIWRTIYSFTVFLFGAGIWLSEAEPSETPAPPDPAPHRRHAPPLYRRPGLTTARPRQPARRTRFPPAG